VAKRTDKDLTVLKSVLDTQGASAEMLALYKDARDGYDTFMAVDPKIVALYRTGTASDATKADDLSTSTRWRPTPQRPTRSRN
jgi:hypothetical protein